MNSFNRWIRSRQGLTIVGIVIVLALIVAVVGTQTSLFGAAGGKKAEATATYTAVPPEPTATQPQANEGVGPQFAGSQGGYSCIPTCVENDGKFLYLAGQGLSTFGGNKAVLWIGVPAGVSTFELGIFDGDSGLDSAGGTNWSAGNWDLGRDPTETTYTLYADPLLEGKETNPIFSWQGNAVGMPNNAWWTQNINNTEAAKASNGAYYYMLKAEKTPAGYNWNMFKVRTSGYLTAGKGDVVGTSLGLMGSYATLSDIKILYPEFVDIRNPGSLTTYTGDWTLFFYVPENTTRLEIWDGDFDRGPRTETPPQDMDDLNTEGSPAWSVPGVTVAERAGGAGIPPDDFFGSLFGLRSPNVTYDILDPDGALVAANENPSGTEEWERFVITSDPAITDADVTVPSLKSGTYTVKIKGLDIANAVWFYVDQFVSGGPPDPPEPPDDPKCIDENLNLGGGHAIIALNPAGCQGQQNGLLFHGTSDSFIKGTAWSNGCLRAVGTTNVQMTDGPVYYVGETFGNMDLIKDATTQQGSDIEKAPAVLDPATYTVAAPDCSDPRAHQVKAKDWEKMDTVNLEPGLYCVSGDLTINAKQSFTGDFVTIYMMDGKLTINGGSTVKLTAPILAGDTYAPALPNILFYVSGSEGRPEVHIEGGNDTVFQGVLYAPGSEVELLGNSFVEGIYRSQIIGWDVRVGGTADLYLGYESLDIPICVYPEP